MPVENAPRSYIVGFKNAELVATMCALVQYVHNSRKFNENANCDIINTDQRARDSVTTFVDLAETMIIRLQDALDEDQIDLLCCGGYPTPTQACGEPRSVRAKAGQVH
jgi:hypothetical protein